MLALGPVLLSAALAGSVAIAVTVAVERWGGRVGGILSTLPTTIVPASIGIAASADSPEAFRTAMASVPAGMLLNAGFLWLWRVLPPRLPDQPAGLRLVTVTALSLGAWALGAVLVVSGGQLARDQGLPPLLLGLGTTLLIGVAGVAACVRPVPAPTGRRRVGPVALLGRGVLAAGAIGLSVLVAASGHPLLAGVASVFPAIFLTSMVSLWLAQGQAVPIGAVGPMMLGSTSVASYALLASLTLPALGPALGVPLAWLVAVACTSLPSSAWLAWRARAAPLSASR